MQKNSEITCPRSWDTGHAPCRAGGGGGGGKSAQIALATKEFRAIDLSCRACGACSADAGCWAWIPVRGNLWL